MIVLFIGGGRKGYEAMVGSPTGQEPRSCPVCGGYLHRHGSYPRGEDRLHGVTSWLRILRMRCVRCGKTHAVYPWFLVRYQRMSTPCLEQMARRWVSGSRCGACWKKPAGACAP